MNEYPAACNWELITCIRSTPELLFAEPVEFVQVYDSTYIYHRLHLTAHLLEYLEREGFPSWVGQKRIRVSLNRRYKIEFAKTKVFIWTKSNDGKIQGSYEITGISAHHRLDQRLIGLM